MQIRDQALSVPACMSKCVNLNPEEAAQLYALLHKVIDGLSE